MSYYEKAEQSQVTPVCITLIGLPGLGKSTWAHSFRPLGLDNQVISFDDLLPRNFGGDSLVENTYEGIPIGGILFDGESRRTNGSYQSGVASYQDSFNRNKVTADMKAHSAAFSARVTNCQRLPCNVIVDSTNITKVKRKYIRSFFPSTVFEHYAVFFPCISWEALCEINNERMARNRSISPEVLKIMYDTYINESSDFPSSVEAKLYKEVMVPNFQNITNDGVFYD
jgi:hypothetical protein